MALLDTDSPLRYADFLGEMVCLRDSVVRWLRLWQSLRSSNKSMFFSLLEMVDTLSV